MIADPVHDVVGYSGLSDSARAIEFAKRYANRLRFVSSLGWHAWTGHRWQEDQSRARHEAAKELHTDLALEATMDDSLPPNKRPQAVKEIRSAKAIQATTYLAESDPRLLVMMDQLDADPYTLATPDGEVNLRDGTIGPSRPESFCTRSTAVSPSNEPAPRWKKFLHTVTDGDVDLERYLQRAAGYALVGEVVEHALLFLYGRGANGKSTFVNTLAAVMGDYAQAAPMDTFTETSGNQHPTELAMLRGARLVTASETEDGRRWASARIKQSTGGDRIVARRMRQDFFEYTPVFLLLISDNHKPGLRSVDEATRRRLHLVPFTATIPKAQRDPNLPKALRAEWPAILRWAIDGCLEWQRQGLNPPPVVTAATEAYLSDEDILGQWLDQATDSDTNAFEAATALHDDYRAWAERSGEKFLGAKRFGQALEDRGMQRHRSSTARGFTGRRLKTLGERPWNRRSQGSLLD